MEFEATEPLIKWKTSQLETLLPECVETWSDGYFAYLIHTRQLQLVAEVVEAGVDLEQLCRTEDWLF